MYVYTSFVSLAHGKQRFGVAAPETILEAGASKHGVKFVQRNYIARTR